MSDAQPPEFKPITSGLASEPKIAPELAQISGPLRAFYVVTQPVYEQAVEARKKMIDKSLSVTRLKTLQDEYVVLQEKLHYYDHAERFIRGMPYHKMSAETGLRFAREMAHDKISDVKADPDETLAAQNNLKLLDTIKVLSP